MSSISTAALAFVGGSKVKLVVATVLITFIISAAGAFWYKMNSLEKEIVKLQEANVALTVNNQLLTSNNETLKSNTLVLQEANETNSKTVAALVDERESAQRAVNTLAAIDARNKAALAAARTKLATLSKDPLNDGPVAPVLRETIKAIQQDRGAAR